MWECAFCPGGQRGNYYTNADIVFFWKVNTIPENKRAILKNSLCRKAHALLNKGLEYKDKKIIREAEDTIKKMRKECYFEDCEECFTVI